LMPNRRHSNTEKVTRIMRVIVLEILSENKTLQIKPEGKKSQKFGSTGIQPWQEGFSQERNQFLTPYRLHP